jgi:hypothetical protein
MSGIGGPGFEFDRSAVPPSIDAAIAALLEAGPEAAEHLMKAAQELLLAAKAVVDAGERALAAQRAAAAADGATREAASDAGEPLQDERAPGRRVRRIDLA